MHGPVQATSRGTAWARRYATWQHEMDTLVGLAELNEADTVQQAGRALNKVSWNENTMLADDQGNIAWYHPGRLPIRPKRWDERLPLPRHRQRGVARLPQALAAPARDQPRPGLAGELEQHAVEPAGRSATRPPPSARAGGCTAAPSSAGWCRPTRRSPSYDADQGRRPHVGHDGPAALAARRRSCARPRRRSERAAPRPCSTRSWRGTATTTAPTPRAPSEPGRGGVGGAQGGGGRPAAGRRRDWLGGRRAARTRSTSAARTPWRSADLTPAGLRRAAANAATALGDPGTWRQPRADVRRHRARRRAEARFEVL